jgi:hypothetical protein
MHVSLWVCKTAFIPGKERPEVKEQSSVILMPFIKTEFTQFQDKLVGKRKIAHTKDWGQEDNLQVVYLYGSMGGIQP